MKTGSRIFIDAPRAVRCLADIKLPDGSAAQCGRREMAKWRGLCWQHRTKGEGFAYFHWHTLAYPSSRECVHCPKLCHKKWRTR